MSIEEQLQAITATIAELVEVDRRIQARHEGLAQTVELMGHDLQDLKSTVQQLATASQQDAENIRALARIAELHSRRMDDHQHRIEDVEGK